MSEQAVHIIVITKDRPNTMRRCIQQMKLAPIDRLTILDDSSSKAFGDARRLLSSMPIPAELSHWATQDLFSRLKMELPEEALKWTYRRFDRDIAPLRNLSLLISACNPSKFTILVDDDITEIDTDLTRQAFMKILCEHSVAVAGAHIVGTDDVGVLDRLTRAVGTLKLLNEQLEHPVDDKILLQTSESEFSQSFSSVDYVSGGYLAFRLPIESLIPFPPGYNEDWLWCLEIVRCGIAKVFRLPQSVNHDPPCIRRMTKKDILFELLGDLVFDLATKSLGSNLIMRNYSDGLRSTTGPPFNIDHEILPMTRVRDVVEQSRSWLGIHRFVDVVLGLLDRMLNDGSLEIDWRSEIAHWQEDSDNKRHSFTWALAHKAQLQQVFSRKEILT